MLKKKDKELKSLTLSLKKKSKLLEIENEIAYI